MYVTINENNFLVSSGLYSFIFQTIGTASYFKQLVAGDGDNTTLGDVIYYNIFEFYDSNVIKKCFVNFGERHHLIDSTFKQKKFNMFTMFEICMHVYRDIDPILPYA